MAKTICIIDDEPGIRAELGNWLEDYGYAVMTAASGAEALEKIRQNRPSLVILDIIMPEIDGLEVLTILKSDPMTSSIPVIMLSAKKETATIIKAQGLQAQDYFMKPFENDEFIRSIRRYV